MSFEQHAQSTVVRLLQMHFLKYIFIKTLSLQVGYILSASKDIYGFNAFMFQTFSFVELIWELEARVINAHIYAWIS